jgi:hypothetical protein
MAGLRGRSGPLAMALGITRGRMIFGKKSEKVLAQRGFACSPGGVAGRFYRQKAPFLGGQLTSQTLATLSCHCQIVRRACP